MSTRLAKESDIEALAAIEQQQYGEEAYPKTFFYQALRTWSSGFWVVQRDGRVQGYALWVPQQQDQPNWLLMSVLIARSAQGQGLGRVLLEASMTSLQQRQPSLHFELSVAPTNHAGIALYQSLGFQTIEEKFNYLGPDEDRLIMVKNTQ